MPQCAAGAGQFPVFKQVMNSVPQVKRVVKGSDLKSDQVAFETRKFTRV